ncbi:TetR/AcrR family transcriptional regulator [Burkholderia multivorans]|uniref:TetR/AcrR family transcriptional regulator n=1 Tax=Burkholderia multivorans TaxID=87883 RepID=UPI000D002654|nr:TetR/AcrR family transcriptional regulator [Burkholderia multivorans]MBU9312571.1 TetR/AcrR family transcriptional regulator [Burkholderia multivorans]MCA8250745.1 TetR/AcrR family transcriptional regulator [Burkholderia multivorans]MCA8457300.1 TetR/AcrR family transcriptional regulator [Burkholderia multivorans]MDN7870418.1 TetR/AcrR family transcriptional regulator [Burkholderia multivorans]PRH33854.1 TetR/AcrR family transcriptional regulator [Burkholderia multivorans]
MTKKVPVRRRTQAERREETRSRILDAAVSELTNKGYAGFRVDQVAATAKVSRGAQTHHFPTKEALVLAALQRLYQASTEASMKLIEGLESGDDVLDALMRDSASFYLGPNFIIAVSLLHLGDHEPELRQKVRAISRKYRLPVEKAWLQALLRSGLAEEPAKTVLNITQSIYRGMVMRKFLRNDPEYTRFTTEQWSRIARAYLNLNAPSR